MFNLPWKFLSNKSSERCASDSCAVYLRKLFTLKTLLTYEKLQNLVLLAFFRLSCKSFRFLFSWRWSWKFLKCELHAEVSNQDLTKVQRILEYLFRGVFSVPWWKSIWLCCFQPYSQYGRKIIYSTLNFFAVLTIWFRPNVQNFGFFSLNFTKFAVECNWNKFLLSYVICFFEKFSESAKVRIML